ncbi:MAG: chemotaxis response regulator protein-glutamate methylesterase [Bacillota bacterium]|nr:chemotaxis response regulator protein-glutamate methylesterase [Bacillota bacterium]
MSKIKVLIVDDSALMRRVISDMLSEENDIEVIGTARNGDELLKKIDLHKPDIITLDIEMPVMDGIMTLKEMKRQNINIPTIVLSSVSQKGTALTMECLHLGAFDFLPKPSGAISLDLAKVKDDLVQKVRTAFGKKIYKNNETTRVTMSNNSVKRNKIANNRIDAVVIGASTGGPKALYNVITKLPGNLGVPVFVVQHMPVGFTKAFADRLNSNSNMTVLEATDGQVYERNVVYVAPGGYHMEVANDKKIHLNTEPSIWGVRPAVDKLFISASKVFGQNIVSAVLTGMGRDGANGTEIIKNGGGITISEDESTCVIYGMPKATYETGKVDIVLPIDKIADEIVKIVENGRR